MSQNRPLSALQLYTVRDATAQDMLGTLRRVAALVYEGVEFAGLGNASLDESDLRFTSLPERQSLEPTTEFGH